MFAKQFLRLIHNTRIFCATDKNALSALRKKTGYTFANCKKALELHQNDLKKAEEWLKEQAQTLGWAKATKLEGRHTTQGLVGVLINENIGAMVEVNCETDFVARNEHFRHFVDQVSQVCVQYTASTDFDGDLWKLGFENEALNHLKMKDGSTLGDQLALLIGTVGENATIKRAICFKTKNDLRLCGYTHPTGNNNIYGFKHETQFGKYGTIMAFRSESIDNELERNLCQHIVGMNPLKIGEEEKDNPAADKDEETCLIYQEYLLDGNLIVGDILEDNGIQIIDYQRYECGDKTKVVMEDIAELKN